MRRDHPADSRPAGVLERRGGSRQQLRIPAPNRIRLVALTILLLPILLAGGGIASGAAVELESPAPSASPQDTAVIASDSFGRSVRRGFGAADVGGKYATTSSRADYSVAYSAGRLALRPGTTRSALLAAVAEDLTIRVDFSLDRLPDSGNAWVYLVARHAADGSEIRAYARVDQSGALWVGATSVDGDVETPLGDDVRVADGAVAAGPWYRLEAQVSGTPAVVAVRAWPGLSMAPPGWQLTATATSDVRGSGSVGIRAHLGQRADRGLTVLLDDLDVRDGIGLMERATGDVVTLVGAGDIGVCGNSDSRQTAALLDTIPGVVFAVGDLAYPDGTDGDFADCFDPTWGGDRWRMLPALGNHEYHTDGAAGYFHYFGEAASPSGGYYAVDLGDWRVYVLNSECEIVECTTDSAQVRWLRADLAAHPRACSLALWHEPRFASGPHGNNPNVGTFWDALYGAGAELVVNGHDHAYERFAGLDPNGDVDAASGMAEIVTGTGGAGRAEFGPAQTGSMVRIANELGVLRLSLEPAQVSWAWIPVDAAGHRDAGSTPCHGIPVVIPSPRPSGSPVTRSQ